MPDEIRALFKGILRLFWIAGTGGYWNCNLAPTKLQIHINVQAYSILILRVMRVRKLWPKKERMISDLCTNITEN